MLNHGYHQIPTIGSTEDFPKLDLGEIKSPRKKTWKKCFAIFSIWGGLITSVVLPTLIFVNNFSASPLGSGALYVFPGDNHLVSVAPGYLCSGIEVTNVEACSSTSGDIKVDVFLLDNGQPTSDNSFDFTVNHTVSLNGGSPTSSPPDDWYYLVYDLNRQTNVTVSACVVDGARQAYFYIIQGKNNLSQWERNTSGAYWVQESQVDSDCLNSSVYQVSQDDTYYFVLFAKESVVIKANVTFEFASYLAPSNSSFCSITPVSDTCACNMSVRSSGQYLLNTSIASVEPDSESVACIKWHCNGYAWTFVLLMTIPTVLLVLVFTVSICFAHIAWVRKVAMYGFIPIICIFLVLVFTLILPISLPLVFIQVADSAQFTPGDTRLVSFSSIICSGISISSIPPTVDATVYIVNEQPPLNGTNEFQVNITETLSSSQYGYQYTWFYYLHEGSLFSMPSACLVAGDEPVNVYIIKGDWDYSAWLSDSVTFQNFFRSVVIQKGPCLQNPIPELEITNGDSYYIILFSVSTGNIPDKNPRASIVLNFNRTEFTVASGTSYPNCTINGHKLGQSCVADTMDARLGTKALITLSASPESDYLVLTEINWVCLPSIAAWTGISLAIVVVNICILALLIGCMCLLCNLLCKDI